jgi:hypothetical protein
MPTVTGVWPRHETSGSIPRTIQTTLFDLATAIDTVCDPDDDQTPTAMLRHILNSRRVMFTNGPERWRIVCDDAALSGVGE